MYPKFTSPKTLTKDEQRRLLRAVRDQGSARGRALLSLALGTGLRLRELRGLNVGDVSPDGRTVAWKFALDPKLTKGGRGGVAYLSGRVRRDLGRLLRWKRRAAPANERGRGKASRPLHVSRGRQEGSRNAAREWILDCLKIRIQRDPDVPRIHMRANYGRQPAVGGIAERLELDGAVQGLDHRCVDVPHACGLGGQIENPLRIHTEHGAHENRRIAHVRIARPLQIQAQDVRVVRADDAVVDVHPPPVAFGHNASPDPQTNQINGHVPSAAIGLDRRDRVGRISLLDDLRLVPDPPPATVRVEVRPVPLAPPQADARLEQRATEMYLPPPIQRITSKILQEGSVRQAVPVKLRPQLPGAIPRKSGIPRRRVPERDIVPMSVGVGHTGIEQVRHRSFTTSGDRSISRW